jgi:hypothetical protein
MVAFLCVIAFMLFNCVFAHIKRLQTAHQTFANDLWHIQYLEHKNHVIIKLYLKTKLA